MKKETAIAASFDPNHFISQNKYFLISIVIFIAMYVPTLIWMWDRWFVRDSYYTHGVLIPFVTIYLIWQRREELSRITPTSSGWGIVLIVAGLIIHLLSSLLRIYFSSGLSMLVVLLGLILFFYGTQIARKVLFPLFFLIFMVPAPLVVITNLSFKLKLFAAQIASELLNNMGFHNIREGSMLIMRNAYVVVDDVCSGLRSLISLTALGSIFAYWLRGPMYKRVLLFLSTIPIAIITNVCRIIFLSTVSEIWGPKYASGFIHDLSGMLVFALAFVLLFVLARVME